VVGVNDVLRPTIRSLERLARALALESHGAADIAQEAWLTALRKGVSGVGLERWLAGAARRIARSSRRDEARRREREQRVEPAVAAGDPAAALGRLELARRLVAAVEDLPEAQRLVIVMRFFEELPAQRIAARLDIPVATVRSRVRRGLETLRGRLDRSALLALAPLSLGGTRRGAQRLLPWQGVGVAALGMLVLGLGLRLASAPPGTERAAGAALALRPGEEARGGGGLVLDAVDAAGGTRSSLAPASDARNRGESSPIAAPAAALPEAEVRGRLLRAEGAPAAGTRLVLRAGRVFLSQPGSLAGLAEASTEARATRADDEGRFALRIQPAQHVGYDLELVDALARRWELPPLVAGGVLDLGDLVLARGGSIRGELVDARGAALPQNGWTVLANAEATGTAVDPAGPATVADVSLSVTVDPTTGAFELLDLPPGEYELEACHALAGPSEATPVALEAGGEVHVTLTHAGPDLSRRLRLDLGGSARIGALPEPAQLLLRAANGATWSAEPLADAPLSFVFDGLADGPLTLRIDDPRYRAWSRDGLEAGTRVAAELAGSATLVVDVLAAATGSSIDLFTLRARRLEERVGYSDRVWHLGDEPLPGGRIEGVVPGSYALTVSAEGHGDGAVEVTALAPGETRRVVVQLGPATWLSGRIEAPGGAPAAGRELRLFPASLAPERRALRPPLRTARTSGDGTFRLQLPAGGSFWLEARPIGPGAPIGQAISIGDGQSIDGLLFVLP